MHMSDALLSPAVGGTLWAAAGGAIAWSSRRAGRDLEGRALPLMGVLGAFVFAAQMINIAIPGTGSSGHLGGGLLLAILLGPVAAFLAMTSILVVQAFLFADGGLLALGCNIVNMGLIPSFVGYAVFQRLGGRCGRHLHFAAVVAAMVSVQLGAMAVVAETTLSGISELPFQGFSILMASIHLPIGLLEGTVTALVYSYLRRARPDILPGAPFPAPAGHRMAQIIATLAAAAVLTAGVLSWYASDLPDGLEWSILRTAGTEEVTAPRGEIHDRLHAIQERTALLPDYRFRQDDRVDGGSAEVETSAAGLVGGFSTLVLAGLFSCLLRWRKDRREVHG